MRRLCLLTIACAASALGGCAATYPTYVMSPRPAPTASSMAAHEPAYGSAAPRTTVAAEASEVSSAEQPRPRPRVASRATRSDAPRVSETSPSDHPRYTAEWWQEQDRLDTRTKRALDICRGC